jgi:hypothetical protein
MRRWARQMRIEKLREGVGPDGVQRKVAACVRCMHEDVQPATRGSVRYGNVLRMERQQSGLDGPLVRTRS